MSDDTSASPSVLPSRPVQRPGVRLWNGVARALKHRTRPFDAGELMKAAVKKTGLTDFGPPSFEEPLERFLKALNTTEDLHPFGVYYTRTFWLLSSLGNRLCLEAAWRPEMDEIQVSRPLIILGLPRTGTTHLVNLLSFDPCHRFLSNAERLHPAGTIGLNEEVLERYFGRYVEEYGVTPERPTSAAKTFSGPSDRRSLRAAASDG